MVRLKTGRCLENIIARLPLVASLPKNTSMFANKKLSILTVQYRSTMYRPKLLESLERFTDDYEYLEQSNDAQNVGFARANNNLIRKSKGKYIILLNPDCEVTENWADRLVQKAEEENNVGIVAPKLFWFDKLIDNTGHDYSNWPYTVRDRGQGEEDSGQYDKSTELVSCAFGCALIKRELVKQIGLLDERFFLYYEDVEYCLRARKAGWRIVFCPDSVVYHERSGSGYNKWMRRSQRYMPYILRKYFPKKMLAKWYLQKAKGTIAGVKNKDLNYASRHFWPMVYAVW